MRRYFKALKEDFLHIILYSFCSGFGYMVACVIFSWPISENWKYIIGAIVASFIAFTILSPVIILFFEEDK